MFYGSNLLRNDNPRWSISNAAETLKVPATGPDGSHAPEAGVWDRPRWTGAGDMARGIGGAVCSACGIAAAWLAGLPRRAGRRLYALNDKEAGWHSWQVTETLAGLGRQYRNPLWDALKNDPSIRNEAIDEPIRRDDTGCPLAGGG